MTFQPVRATDESVAGRTLRGQYVSPVGDESSEEHAPDFDWPAALRIAAVASAAACVWFGVWELHPSFSAIGAFGLVVGGWPIFKEAFENLLAHRMTMELSMTIAIVAAAAIGQFFTALVITLFVLVAEVLEDLTVGRGRRAIRDLLEFLPREVSVRRAETVSSVSADDLAVGDVVLINPGGRVPVDGRVLSGHSFVDESRITGESMPVEKTRDAIVFAGSINQSGLLEVAADRVGRDTSYSKIIEIVERAEHSRAPVQRLADQLAGYLVYFALGSAALTFLLTRDIVATISVIIVAGACGIAAGTPLALLGSIGRAARLGAIVKGGVHLETLGRVDTVLFDKTGTLTFGRPDVQEIASAAGVAPEELLDAAAAAELRSEHALGQAIVKRAHEQGLSIREPQSFSYCPGRGIDADVDGETVLVGNRLWLEERGIPISRQAVESVSPGFSQVLVAREGRFLGSITISDTVRPEAKQAVETLQRMGIRTILLTGDASTVAEKVGTSLGITEIHSELLPEDKLTLVRSLIAKGRVVAMVGDGVNDAPALTAASVGIGMGSGTDVAQESADVVLLGNDLCRLVDTLVLARRTRGIIWQNFAGTLGVDALGIALAACGVLAPLLAAFIHVTSELVFILNSARLLPSRIGRGRVLLMETSRPVTASSEAESGA